MLYHLTKLAVSEESAWVRHSNAPYSRNLPIERLFCQVIVMRWNPVQSGNSQTGQKLKLNLLFRIAQNGVEWYVSSLNSTFSQPGAEKLSAKVPQSLIFIGKIFASGHALLETPDPIRTLMLGNIEP